MVQPPFWLYVAATLAVGLGLLLSPAREVAWINRLPVRFCCFLVGFVIVALYFVWRVSFHGAVIGF